MGDNKEHKVGIISLFILPVIVLLFGIACIGYSSEVASRQERWNTEYTVIEGTVEAKGEMVNLDYDYGVDMSNYNVTKKTMQIKYTNERGITIRKIYEKEPWVGEDENGKITFYIDNENNLMGKVSSVVTTSITIAGGFFILLGFLLATTGLKIAAAEISDDDNKLGKHGNFK